MLIKATDAMDEQDRQRSALMVEAEEVLSDELGVAAGSGVDVGKFFFTRAMVRIKKGDVRRAALDCRRADQLDPATVSHRATAAICHLWVGDQQAFAEDCDELMARLEVAVDAKTLIEICSVVMLSPLVDKNQLEILTFKLENSQSLGTGGNDRIDFAKGLLELRSKVWETSKFWMQGAIRSYEAALRQPVRGSRRVQDNPPSHHGSHSRAFQ